MRSVLFCFVAMMFLSGCPLENDDENGSDSNQPLADGSFSGTFSGAGRLFYSGPASSNVEIEFDCADVKVKVESDDKTFIRVDEWRYICDEGIIYEVETPIEVAIEGNKLISEEGDEVGTISNSTINISFTDEEEGSTWIMQASAFETKLEMRETISSSQGSIRTQSSLDRVVADEDDSEIMPEKRQSFNRRSRKFFPRVRGL